LPSVINPFCSRLQDKKKKEREMENPSVSASL